MKKDLLFPAILVGMFFAALYIYLVAEFATSAYSFLYFVVIPIPFALGMWMVFALASERGLIRAAAILVINLTFFGFAMCELSISPTKIYSDNRLPYVYKSYQELNKDLNSPFYRMPIYADNYKVKASFFDAQGDLVLYCEEDVYSSPNTEIEKYDSLGRSENISYATYQKIAHSPDVFSKDRFIKKEESLRRGNIRPQYMQRYLENGSYISILYFDLVTDQGVEHLKMPVNYEVENPGELLKSPTTYYENNTEKIEVFGSFKFYSNKRLQYQLLKTKHELYMIRN